MFRQLRFVTGLAALVVGLALLAAPAAAQSPLVPLPGSPYIFEIGHWSDVVLLSPDETHVFVSNQGSDTIMVLDVAPDGSLSGPRLFPVSTGRPPDGTLWSPNGMAISPTGDRLYVNSTDRWPWGWGFGTAAISTLKVNPDGSLEPMGDVFLPYPSFAWGGIVYFTQSSGDFVYVNNNGQPNTVTALRVDLGSDPAVRGTLTPIGDFPTGGYGTYGDYGWWVSPSLAVARTQNGPFLYALNGTTVISGSNDITTFAIGTDGALTRIGSPTRVSADYVSGCIAADPAGTALYAGNYSGLITRFTIAPDGSLADQTAWPTGLYGAINTIAFRPGGEYFTAAAAPSSIAVIEAASMRPLIGSPVPGVNVANDTGPSGGVFNAAGDRIYFGTMSGTIAYTTPIVTGYQFTPQPVIPRPSWDMPPPDVTVDHYGVADVRGALTAACPGVQQISFELRQRTGRRVVVAGGSATTTTTGYYGVGNWNTLVANATALFKGGQAEFTATIGGYDPVTWEYVTAEITRIVKIKPGN